MSLIASPVPGTFTAPQLVTLADVGSDAVFYTVDGSAPQYQGYARDWNDGLLGNQTNTTSNGTATFTNPGTALRQTLTAAATSASSFLDQAPVPVFAVTESKIQTRIRFNSASCVGNTNGCVIFRCAGKFAANDTFGYVVGISPRGGVFFGRGSNASTGSYTPIASAVIPDDLSYDTWHTLTVNISGSTFTVSVNGVIYGVWQDSTYLVPGYVGVRTYSGSASAPAVDYDDFWVEYAHGTKYTAPVPVVPGTVATTIRAVSVTGIAPSAVSDFVYTPTKLRAKQPTWSVANRTVTLSGYTSSSPIGSTGKFTDSRDGKVYKTVLMPDGKWWSAENLAWAGAGVYYADDPANGLIYGKLYTWAEVSASIVPQGAHIPTKDDRDNLVTAVGAASAGKFMSPSSEWLAGGIARTDDFGFAAMPGGFANSSGLYNFLHQTAYFWTDTPDYGSAFYFGVSYDTADILVSAGLKANAFSVRFIVDSGNVPDAPFCDIYYTTDGETPSFRTPSWNQTPVAGPYDVCFGPEGRVVAGCSSSLYYSTTSGSPWVNAHVTLTTWQYYGICFNAIDGNYYVANYTGGLYRVSADFSTKTSLGQGGNYPFKIRAATDGTLYAIGVSCYKSIDFGVTWALACSPPGAGTYCNGAFLPDGRLLLVTGDGSQTTSKVTVYNPSDSSQTVLASIPYALGIVVSQSGRAYLGTTSPAKTLTSIAPYSTWTEFANGLIGGGDTSGTQVVACDESRRLIFYIEAGDAVKLETNTYRYMAPFPYNIGMVVNTLVQAPGLLDSLPSTIYPFDTETGYRVEPGWLSTPELGWLPQVRPAWMATKMSGHVGMPAMTSWVNNPTYRFQGTILGTPAPPVGLATTTQARFQPDEGIQISVFPRQPHAFDNRVDWGNGPVTNRTLKVYWRIPQNDNYLFGSVKTDVKKSAIFGDLNIDSQSDTWAIGGAQAQAELSVPELSHYLDVNANLGFVTGSVQSAPVRVTGGRNSPPMAIWLSPGAGNVRLNVPLQCDISLSDPDLDTITYTVTANGTTIKSGVVPTGTVLSFPYTPTTTGALELVITLIDPFAFQTVVPAPELTVLDNAFPVGIFTSPSEDTAVFHDTNINIVFDISDTENESMTWTLLNNGVTIASGSASQASSVSYRFKAPTGSNQISMILADPLGAAPPIVGPVIWGALTQTLAVGVTGDKANGGVTVFTPTVSGTVTAVTYRIVSSTKTENYTVNAAPWVLNWTPDILNAPETVSVTVAALDVTGHGPGLTVPVLISQAPVVGSMFVIEDNDTASGVIVVVASVVMNALETQDRMSAEITTNRVAPIVTLSAVPQPKHPGETVDSVAIAVDTYEHVKTIELQYRKLGTNEWTKVPMQIKEVP